MPQPDRPGQPPEQPPPPRQPAAAQQQPQPLPPPRPPQPPPATQKRDGHRRTPDDITRHDQVRSYGGWRRSRSIGLLGLGTTGTLVLLGCFAGLLLPPRSR